MDTPATLSRIAGFTASCLLGALLAGCGSGSSESGPGPNVPVSTPPGTGKLTVTVADGDGRPISGAAVTMTHRTPTRGRRTWPTLANGSTEFVQVPEIVDIDVVHEFGTWSVASVNVAQSGMTRLAVTLPANRLRPTFALMPVEVLPGSISADRREFTMRITAVASPSSPFIPYGDPATTTPEMVIGLDENHYDWYFEACYLYESPQHPVATCEPTASDWPHLVSAGEFEYSATGVSPFASPPGSARSAMLVLDQSRRMDGLDPSTRRSFAAWRFIERMVRSTDPGSLSIAGFAASGSGTSSTALLPQQPLWLPLGAGAPFSQDEIQLKTNVQVLEPLVGGLASVYSGIDAAVAQTSASAPAGSRTVVVLLGGRDEVAASEAERAQALQTLRAQRDATGVRTILIPVDPIMSRDLDDLATALRAPRIALPGARNREGSFVQSIASGANGALVLAAELIDGVPLPTVSADIHVRKQTGAYAPGTVLHGYVSFYNEICSIGCLATSIDFSVVVP